MSWQLSLHPLCLQSKRRNWGEAGKGRKEEETRETGRGRGRGKEGRVKKDGEDIHDIRQINRIWLLMDSH